MILLVDDRAENLLAYRAILEELDLELVFARSGNEALKHVLSHDFAVILLDVNMPMMDGVETASLIRTRKRSAHTPIIFVTAFPDEFRANQGYAQGAVDYLMTPVVPQVLRAKVKVFVDLFRMTQQVRRQTEERVALAQERARRTAVEDANDRLSFLAEIKSALGQSLDCDITSHDVVRLAIPYLGDHAVVARRQPIGDGWQVFQSKIENGVVRVDVSSGLEGLPPVLSEGIRHAASTGTVWIFPDASSSGSDGESQLAVYPLRGQKFGSAVLAISREESGRRFCSADLTLVEAIAARAAIALENGQLYKDLELADQQKNEFLSMLAHELRNPLAPIRTAVDVLGLRGPDPEEVMRARDIIDRQLGHLVRLVDDLLDVSRITGGKIRLDHEDVDVASVVRAAVETSRPLIETGGHRLTVSLPENPVCVSCDRVRLSQVLANLLNNAAKYTPAGGTISISAAREGREAVFRVRDNGIGIPKEMLAKVFDLFTQVDRSLDRSQGGLGIGLTLARRLVEMHGGTLEALSEGTGRGSEFVVRLSTLVEAPKQETPKSADVARTGGDQLRILVVDDNVDAADSVAWLLRTKKHEVCVAHDGRAAVEVAGHFLPQVVVLDLGLPELDGYEVARRLRAAEGTRHALLLAVSGYGQDEHRKQSQEAGFDCHFVKPVDFNALLRAINEARAPANALLQITGAVEQSP
jgi:signal transduction histidine kinase/DNA-binding response OmpR family regulator